MAARYLVTATVNGFTCAAASISAAYAPESIKVTDDSGKTHRQHHPACGRGTASSRCVSCPREASQEFTPTVKDRTIATTA